jgi:hypothetical protein
MDVRKIFDTGPQTMVYGIEVNRDQGTFVAACEDGFRGSFLSMPQVRQIGSLIVLLSI